MTNSLPHAGALTAEPLYLEQRARISPMPREITGHDNRILTLAIAKRESVVTDIDSTTFEIRRRVRELPLMHRLYTSTNGYSIGCRQRYRSNPATLHFLDPSLRLIGNFALRSRFSAIVTQGENWIVLTFDRGVFCFRQSGPLLCRWHAPEACDGELLLLQIAASEERIIVSCGLRLYALSPHGRLLWAVELPGPRQRHRWTRRTPENGARESSALRTLGLQDTATADDVRRAYRRMARRTHPDLHPENATAAARQFRTVQEAYEILRRRAGPVDQNTRQILSGIGIGGGWHAISALEANERHIAAGTTAGGLFLLNHDGRVVATHQLGLPWQRVESLLLNDSGLLAAYCGNHVHMFDGDLVRRSLEINAYPGHLMRLGDGVLLRGRDTLCLIDRQARIREAVKLDRTIDGVASTQNETFVLSRGYVYGLKSQQ